MKRITVRLKKRLNPPRRSGLERTRTYTLVWRQDGKVHQESLRRKGMTDEEAERRRQAKEAELNLESSFGQLEERLVRQLDERVGRLRNNLVRILNEFQERLVEVEAKAERSMEQHEPDQPDS